MITLSHDEVKAFLGVGAVLFGLSGTGGYTAGRVTAPEPPPPAVVEAPPPEIQYRIVEVPVYVPVPPGKTTDRMDQEPFAEPAPDPTPAIAQPEPSVHVPAPAPRPHVARAKPKATPSKKRAPEKYLRAAGSGLPSCAVIKREYDAMSWRERLSAYAKATPEQIAHGRRCLGL